MAMMDKEKKQLAVPEEQRLDKWLKIARLFKTRAQATQACESRRVKVNDQVAKPAKAIRPGDRLTIRRENGRYINFQVLGLCSKSIAAPRARELYHAETPDIPQETLELMALFSQASKQIKPKYKGRPTKKDRRRLDELQNRS
jgi:ribosome-associated heat shock protein Hsp15